VMTGMNNDVCPVNFRGKFEQDRITADVYYKAAPGWSTLSRGPHPFVMLPPADAADMIERAAGMNPFVRSTTHFVIKKTGVKEQLSLQALKEMAISVKKVPNLHAKRTTPTRASTTPDPQTEVQRKELEVLREEVAVLKSFIADISAASSTTSSQADAQPNANKADGKKRARRA